MNLYLDKCSSDSKYATLASDYSVSSAKQKLYHLFNGSDKISGNTDGNPRAEAEQFTKELFSLIYYNNTKTASRYKGWAKSAFDQIQKTFNFDKLSDECFLDSDKSVEALSYFLSSLSDDIAKLRQDQNKFVKENEFLGIDKEDLEEEFIPDSDDSESLSDKLKKLPTKILQEFKDTEKLEEMLGVKLTAGNDGSELQTGSSVGRQLVNDLKRNPKIREILLKAGSLLDEMNSKTVTDQSTIENIVGIEYGRDLSQLTFGSKTLLLNPITEVLFYDKFCRNQLDVYEYEADTEKGKGPIWVLLDRSSSTKHASRYVIISAIAIAMIHIAKREKRPIWIIEFNGRLQHEYYMDVELSCQRNGKAITLQDMICELAEREPTGGTNFDLPINCALDKDPTAKKADLIMVTDGEATISSSTGTRINQFKDQDMKIYTILLGVRRSSLTPYSDQIVDVESLSSADQETAIGSVMSSVSK